MQKGLMILGCRLAVSSATEGEIAWASTVPKHTPEFRLLILWAEPETANSMWAAPSLTPGCFGKKAIWELVVKD